MPINHYSHNPKNFESSIDYIFNTQPTSKIGYYLYDWEHIIDFNQKSNQFTDVFIHHKTKKELVLKLENNFSILRLATHNKNKNLAFTLRLDKLDEENTERSIAISLVFFTYNYDQKLEEQIGNEKNILLNEEQIKYITYVSRNVFNIELKEFPFFQLLYSDHKDIIAGLVESGFIFVFDLAMPNGIANYLLNTYQNIYNTTNQQEVNEESSHEENPLSIEE